MHGKGYAHYGGYAHTENATLSSAQAYFHQPIEAVTALMGMSSVGLGILIALKV